MSSPTPKRKEGELGRPSVFQGLKRLKGAVEAAGAAGEYKRCWKEFKYPINAVGDVFLHLKPLQPVAERMELAFDVVSQHIIICYSNNSLSTTWPTFKVFTRAIYEIAHTLKVDQLVRIHYLR